MAVQDQFKTQYIPFVDSSNLRSGSTAQDRQFINGYFEKIDTTSGQGSEYYFAKRPGFTLDKAGSGAAEGRGVYFWNVPGGTGFPFYVFGNTIVGFGTSTITMNTSSGMVSFCETRPGATTRYLAITDGDSLYLFDGQNEVLILNNRAITTSSIANPTTITTSTIHGLNTGNRIIIRGHAGSTPSINDTIFTITKINSTQFTIPVNVTVAGAGGTIGIWPGAGQGLLAGLPEINTGSLVNLDGYMFTSTVKGNIFNCAVDDPTTWSMGNFVTSMMQPGQGIALARQNNVIITFSDRHIQAWYDAANPVGSPLANIEQSMSNIGCISRQTVAQVENSLYWVSNTLSGGYTVYRLDGLSNLKDIGTPRIGRFLNATINNFLTNSAAITNISAFTLRIAGHIFYILTIRGSNITFVYDQELDAWCEWTDSNNLFWNIISVMLTKTLIVGGPHDGQLQIKLIGQDFTNGKTYVMSADTTTDNGTNFTVTAETSRFTLGNLRRKYFKSVDLVADQVGSSSQNAQISYSDSDYGSFSTPRNFDMNQVRPFGVAWGNSRRRAWKFTYTGDATCRVLGLNVEYGEESGH